jgi:hypothetical protein
MDNPADHPTIIDPRLASCVVGKKWLQPRKLLTTKQKYEPSSQTPFTEFESDSAGFGNPFYGSGA